MPLLIRHVKDLTPWTECWKKKVTAEVLADFLDKELSMFLVPDYGDPIRVGVALTSMQGNVKEFSWVGIELDVLKKNGFELSQTSGLTPDKIVNQWHFDLHLPTGEAAIQLCQLIATEGQGSTIVLNTIRKELISGILCERLILAKVNIGNQKEIFKECLSRAMDISAIADWKDLQNSET